jgi:hypothetical protein
LIPQASSWILHASSGMVLTPEEVEHHVRQLHASRREEPNQVAAALEAQGGGVPRTIALIERSLAPVDLPASTFESIGIGLGRPQRLVGKSSSTRPAQQCSSQSLGRTEEFESTQDDQGVSLPVIESVRHYEQAAEIGELEAANITAVQHADFIERTLGSLSTVPMPDVETEENDHMTNPKENRDQVIVGKLNRVSKAVREVLSQGVSLRACRNALEEAGHPWRLLSGTLVFVHPWQYRAAISSLSLHELRPYHIIFAESLGYLLEEALAHCKGSWMSACAPVQEHTGSDSQVGTSSDIKSIDGKWECSCEDVNQLSEHNVECVVSVDRTFVCVSPCVSLEAHVISSTTDAHNLGQSNPRLIALQRASLWQC